MHELMLFFVMIIQYHGGTNFGHTSAAFIITGYYDQAPLDEYGIIRQPKFGHLKEMHAALKQSLQPLLYGDLAIEHLGEKQDVRMCFVLHNMDTLYAFFLSLRVVLFLTIQLPLESLCNKSKS